MQPTNSEKRNRIIILNWAKKKSVVGLTLEAHFGCQTIYPYIDICIITAAPHQSILLEGCFNKKISECIIQTMTLWLFSRFDWLEFLSHLFFFASFEYLQSLKCSATLSPESRQPARVPKSSSITRRRQIGWWVYDGIRFEHPALLLLELLFNNFYAKGYHRRWGRTLRLKMSAKKGVCARKEKKNGFMN